MKILSLTAALSTMAKLAFASCTNDQIGCAVSDQSKPCVLDGTYAQCTGTLGTQTIAGAKNGFYVAGDNWLQAIKCAAQSGCTTSDETKPCVLTSEGYKLACTTTTASKHPTTKASAPKSTASPVSTMCANRFDLPSTNKKSMWGANGHVGTCRAECIADPSCKAISYENDPKSKVWCFGCKDLAHRTENAWGLTWQWEAMPVAAATTTAAGPGAWTKIVGKTCNTHREMVLGQPGRTLADCKAEADTVGAPLFSWGKDKWCLLCEVDSTGKAIDDDDSTTYDMYIGGVPPSTTEEPTTTHVSLGTTTAAKRQTCYSVGDPHVQMFNGAKFDTHTNGWKTLYAKGSLHIQVEQATWRKTGGGVAINRAVRYSTDGGKTWDETVEGGALLSSGSTKLFRSPDVTLTVGSGDYSSVSWASDKYIYNVFVTTSEYGSGATGQCVQGKLRRRLREAANSDGVVFPSGDEVKVTKEQAQVACAGLSGQKENCLIDVRMANDPAVTDLITKDFVGVEATLSTLDPPRQTTVAITSEKMEASGAGSMPMSLLAQSCWLGFFLASVLSSK